MHAWVEVIKAENVQTSSFWQDISFSTHKSGDVFVGHIGISKGYPLIPTGPRNRHDKPNNLREKVLLRKRTGSMEARWPCWP